jgi:hypothetical protein
LKQISIRRGSPERRPVVVMSIVRSSMVEEQLMASAWRTSSRIGSWSWPAGDS